MPMCWHAKKTRMVRQGEGDTAQRGVTGVYIGGQGRHLAPRLKVDDQLAHTKWTAESVHSQILNPFSDGAI